MRFLWLVWLTQGCAYISDKHEDWRLDPDDDGVGIVEDCDSSDASVGAERAWYRDVDEDGFGDEADVTYGCDRPDGYAAEPGDCDDTDSTISPEAAEVCDGADNDCNGEADDGLPLQTVYEDMDGDGFGDPSAAVQACGAIEGLVDNGNDCDDTNRFMQEQRTIETHYNGIDDNCDISDGDGDADGDGHWAEDYVAQLEGLGIEPMPVPEGMGDDCNDDDATVFPGADDAWYDGVDSDCGGEDDCDIDGDGYQPSEGVCGPADGDEADCNDHNPDINPGAVEVCSSVEDENCDGDTVGVDAPDCIDWFQDLDSDGFGVTGSEICQCAPSFPHTAVEGRDCNDFDSFFNPDAFEIPRDGRDHDCAGDDDYDWDGDGYVADVHVGLPTHHGTEPGVDGEKLVTGTGELPGGDCDDDDPAISPEGIEICDGEDNDCDLEVDEGRDATGCTTFYTDADGDAFGDDDLTACLCVPTSEFSATVGGDCVDSEVSDGSEGWSPEYFPGAPDAWYDGFDTDCAGNDDYDQDGDGHAQIGTDGYATAWLDELVEGALDGRLSSDDCDDESAAVNPDADEVCDGRDNDCNGAIDDGVIDVPMVFHDGDGDGFGDPETGEESCESFLTPGFVLDDNDCDDTDAAISPAATEVCDGADNDCNGETDEGFRDLDGDARADCVDSEVLIADVADEVWEGAAGSRAGESLLVGVTGEVYVGAPFGVGFPMKSHVYMVDALAGSAVDLDAEAEKLTWDREGFGWTLAMLDEGELLVGIQQHNAVVKIESPLIGHPIPYTVSDPTTGDTFAYTDAIPTALTGETDLGEEPSGDPQCGFTVAAGAFVDEAGSQGIFVGCPGLNQPSVAYRDADWTDHTALDAIGWSVGTGDDGGSGIEQFGYSASVGDVNGDGVDDLLVGEPRADHGLRNSGAAYLYFGPVSDSVSRDDWDSRVVGDAEQDSLGRDVQVVPDLDLDGYPEVLASSNSGFWIDAEVVGSGAVLVFSGDEFSGDMMEVDADVRIEGSEPSSQFGFESQVIPDVDGDGAAEMVIGATNAGGDLSGAIYGLSEVWTPGTRTTADADVWVIRGAVGARLGHAVTLGDVGADGTLELLVSGPGADRVWILDPSALFTD